MKPIAEAYVPESFHDYETISGPSRLQSPLYNSSLLPTPPVTPALGDPEQDEYDDVVQPPLMSSIVNGNGRQVAENEGCDSAGYELVL